MCVCVLYSFKEEDIISEWDFKVDTVKAAPAAVPVANTNRKTTKRQLMIDNAGQHHQQKRSSIPSIHNGIISNSATEQLLDKTTTTNNEASVETTSVEESEFSTATEEVLMDLSSKQVASLHMHSWLLCLYIYN